MVCVYNLHAINCIVYSTLHIITLENAHNNPQKHSTAMRAIQKEKNFNVM